MVHYTELNYNLILIGHTNTYKHVRAHAHRGLGCMIWQ